MRIKLEYKIFGALFFIAVLVILTIIFSRYLFNLSFNDYIHESERRRLEGMVPDLQAAYLRHGSWSAVLSDDPEFLLNHLRLTALKDLRANVPQPPVPEGLLPDASNRPRISDQRGPPDVILTDQNGKIVFGNSLQKGDRPGIVPVCIEGDPVGWLGVTYHVPPVGDPPRAVFLRYIFSLIAFGAVVILLMGVTAFFLSRRFSIVIQRLVHGTEALASRNFHIEIKSENRDELGKLTEKFNAMVKTLAQYEEMQRQWLSDISHELRTPLTILRGEVESLQCGIRKPTAENMDSLYSEIIRISDLVEDLHLLSLADVEQLSMNRQFISPVVVLANILKRYQRRFQECRIETKLQIGPMPGKDAYVYADKKRLEQVFVNIFENSCKYIAPPGILQIHCLKVDDDVVLYFKDSGPGVSEADLLKIFDRLYRVDKSRNRASGGSGLGLSISKKIIENHDGQMWAENNTSGGLTLGITLPLEV